LKYTYGLKEFIGPATERKKVGAFTNTEKFLDRALLNQSKSKYEILLVVSDYGFD
jgi:hypothetical protein